MNRIEEERKGREEHKRERKEITGGGRLGWSIRSQSEGSAGQFDRSRKVVVNLVGLLPG